ncbi:MAG: hypothetical protein KAS74_04170 [Methanosarcinales archaeon]|nr:hypothetical protein [Methanosarcinales archaeon]
MNKNIMLPLVALMILAMVGAASAADEVTTLNKLEIRGSVQDFDGPQTEEIEWNATNFAAFWYDIDEDLMTETLTIKANSLDGNIAGGQRTIAEDNLIYHTEPVAQEYELYEDGGMQLESGVDNRTHYFVEGWLAERYIAINDQADTLCKLLVEFEDDDKKTLSTGEGWDLGGGFTLTAQQIDLEGEKCWLTLEKDGKELDSEVISTGAATLDKNDSVYTCTQDIGSEDDVPMFSCHIDAVFRGTDTNIVQLQYVFLHDNEVLEIDSGDEFGIMEADATTNYINLTNEEDTVDLSQDNKEHIMGNIYFQTADNGGTGEDNRLRFYPMVEYTEPGTYEVRGTVQDFDGPQTEEIEWDATNFAAFWYDIDEDLMTETLTIKAGSLDGDVTGGQRTIDEDNLVYHTEPVAQEYELYEDGGMELESGVDDQTHYYVEGFMAERYVAINNQADTLCKLLVEFEDDDKKTLSTGEGWDLGSGFVLTAQQIDLEGEKVWLTLEKDGKELDSEVISTGGAILDKNDSVYTCTQDIGSEDDVPMFSCHVDAVFRGTDTNIVQLQYVFLHDNDVLEIDSGDEFGIMEADATTNYINLTNEEDTVDLSQDNREHIMGNIYFQTADNGGTGEDNRLRFYPVVEYTIGGVAAAEPEETATEEATEVATGVEGEVEVEGEVVATATATAEVAETAEPEAEETATPKKTPGFEAVFAISGLLAIAYLVLRQRD